MGNRFAKMAFLAAVVYLGFGLASGVFNREYTKGTEFGGIGGSQLGVTHTHFLVLGFIIMLIVVLLARTIKLSTNLFLWFFWVYNAGMIISMSALFVRGMTTISYNDPGAALSGIAGLGHILLAAALIILMVAVGNGLSEDKHPAKIERR